MLRSLLRSLCGALLILFVAVLMVLSREEGSGPAPASPSGGVQVLFRADFDQQPSVFTGSSGTAVEPDQRIAPSGHSLHVRRAQPGGGLGAQTDRVVARGVEGLRIAFCVRSKGMDHVTVNLRDVIGQDNTTPSSPARVLDDTWRTVVFAVEDFHPNSAPASTKVTDAAEFRGLLFHGDERRGSQGEFWLDKLVVYRGRDTQPPQAPGRLRAVAAEAGSVSLAWDEPADNAFPAVYSIYRKDADGPWTKIGESVEPRYVDAPPAAGAYHYRVTAADYDNNLSAPSEPFAVRTEAAGTSAAVAPAEVQDRKNYAAHVRTIHRAGLGKVRPDVFLFAGDSITAADAYTLTLGGWLRAAFRCVRE